MRVLPFLVATALAVASSSRATAQSAPAAPACVQVTAANAEDCLRLNHVQVVGTHNSYHAAPEPAILKAIGDHAASLDYTHRPLPYQLETLRESRGKILFAMDNAGAPRDAYLAGHPSLKGRVLFVSVEARHPAAAFMKLNDATGPAADRIAAAVRNGFIVRTRSDEPGREAVTGDTTRRDSAFRSGAQYVSTDYPEPSPYASGKGYVVNLPGGVPVARCNPVSAPKGCQDTFLSEK